MSKNGPTTTRFGFSVADAIASKVPVVRARTNGQINLSKLLTNRPDLAAVVEARRSENWRDARIAEWLKDNGYAGTFRLRTWFDKGKQRPLRTEYSFTPEPLRERAESGFSKGHFKRARLSEWSPDSKSWKKRDRWPVKRGKMRKY